MDIVERLRGYVAYNPKQSREEDDVMQDAADEIGRLRDEAEATRADVIEECVRLALEKAIKLETQEIGRAGAEGGSVRLNPTAYQWRTIANELRALQACAARGYPPPSRSPSKCPIQR